MEFVFVVPRRELFPDHFPQGFVPFGEVWNARRLEEVVERCGFFVERSKAELNPDWKQVIPYNVVVSGSEVLLLKRTKAGGEARLHHKLSIGVGGHLNPEDLDESRLSRNPIPRGTGRELDEELAIDGSWELEPVGLINDDSNPVGAVHVGLVQLVRLQGTVGIRETQVLEGRLASADELLQMLRDGANFETWSAQLVAALPSLLLPLMRSLATATPISGSPMRS